MLYKYGEFSSNQIAQTKEYMRKRIFFLLLIVDPKTKDEYENVNVKEAFECELKKLGGLNSILFYPPELVRIIALLEAALNELSSPTFNWNKYRKLVLDAGNEVLKIKEVEEDAISC